MEIAELLAERKHINKELRSLREGNSRSIIPIINALEKRKGEIKYRLEMLRETPERKERRMTKKAETNAAFQERYRYQRKLREKTYTDPFLSDVDVFHNLTKHMHPSSIPKLSPELLREFGYTTVRR